MVHADVLTLIAESPEAHGVFETHTRTSRDVYCEVRSVTRNEMYAAKSAGLDPEYVFVLSDYAEYCGEKICKFNSVTHRIIRTYVIGTRIELTVERVTNDA